MLELPEALHIMVARQFRAAKRTKSLIFSDTELAVIHSGRDVPFQLRYCPALAKKPTAVSERPQKDHSKPKPDPFENPSADLLVAEVPKSNPSHTLVLNKYPVIANHFILATKISKPQIGLLEQDDLSITYQCLRAWEEESPKDENRRLFAFFNSGEHSGASQAHRHLQFLPVEDMAGESSSGWLPLIDRMNVKTHTQNSVCCDPSLPFLHYATKLDSTISPEMLHSKYQHLLRTVVCALKAEGDGFHILEDVPIEKDGHSIISYNLAMTTNMMAICPRKSESAQIPVGEKATNSVAINGTILGGTLMVKEQREWESLKMRPSLLDEILSTIGYCSISEELGEKKLRPKQS